MKKRILIITLTISILIAGFIFFIKESSVTFFDQPNELSNHVEQIEVGYVNWACDCANFYETQLFSENSDYKLKADDCIFIEAKDKSHTIPKNYFDTIYRNNNLRLTGRFYLDKGISATYEMKTSEKPKYARVFQFDSFEIIDENKN